MNDLLRDFKDYFKGKGLVTEENCSLDYMASTKDPNNVQIAINEYQGVAGRAQDPSAHRSIQIVVRSQRVSDARGKIKELYNSLLTDNHIIQLTPERWGMLYLRQPPFKYKVDENHRVHYAFNLGITTYLD